MRSGFLRLWVEKKLETCQANICLQIMNSYVTIDSQDSHKKLTGFDIDQRNG